MAIAEDLDRAIDAQWDWVASTAARISPRATPKA
jgi:hypothetical protein